MVVGVSGAGKTTLLKVLHNQAQSRKSFGKIVHIDSTPFGRSPRSNPATYTGLSDVLRDLFAAAPEAKKRRFTKTHFSLAVPGGRCEDCQGAGLKQIGMHFLGNVEIPCETCHGKRFSADVLEVRVADKNMFDVLDMTVADAHAFFENEPKIRKYTQPLIDLGLGYVKLGQSSTTLSGGEAQRVKLASELVRSATASTLFILDEPATGLHPYDVGNLILAIRKLSAKHTVVIAGHDLRMIAQADFVVELGPGSGNDGGNVVFAGTPAALMAKADSLTGKALISQKNFKKPICKEVADLSGLPVVLKNVGTNNLQIDEVTFEANRLTAVCGPSGSGKSSLVFDTLYSASQNALLDGLSFRIRQNMSKAGNAVLDEFSGLMPAIALEKKSASKNPRSTVATYTGVYDLYRLLMSRFSKNNNEPCKLYSTAFSFNHEQGACPECHGLGYITQCDPQKLVSNPALSLEDGALDGSKPGKFYGETLGQYVATLRTVGKIHGFDFSGPFSQLCSEAVSLAMHGCGETLFDVEWHYKRGNLSGTHRMKIAWLGFCGLVEEEYSRKHFDHRAVQFSGIMTDMLCKVCEGNRVHRERLEYRFNGKHIGELTQMSATEAMEWFSSGNIPTGAESIVAEIAERLKSLIEAGIGYIGLNRISSTLSGGEFQRLRMASLLQSQLSGVMIVMDEPSFGLSKSDAKRISMLLKKVVLRGNTMAITDHHPEMLSNASAVISLGPYAGKNGGKMLAGKSPETIVAEIFQIYDSIKPLEAGNSVAVSVKGARANNLQHINVDFIENTLNVITGNSGSGKTSLLQYVVYDSFLASRPIECDKISGFSDFDNVVFIQQDVPAGSSMSIPATMLDLLDPIRNIFTDEAANRTLPLKAAHFSVFSKEGRCAECGGTGVVKTSMDFSSDAESVCESCNGARFNKQVLDVMVDGKSISDILNMSIFEAALFVEGKIKPAKMLVFRKMAETCHFTGIDYIPLGQNLNTLSVGELQRLKLVQGIADAKGKTLFLLDEPSGGLHPTDTQKLLELFDYLLANNHTIICASHDELIIRRSGKEIGL
jgi:excinuclease ABC subunit A